MHKTIYLYVMLAIASLGLLGSCYDDKGNYDYSELAKVEIDTVSCGIQESYVVSRFDNLTIAPKIYYNGKEVTNDASAPLTYLWTIYPSATGVGVTYFTDTLATTPQLNTEVTTAAGSYIVQLTVTNTENNIKYYFNVSCGIEGNMPTQGWMVLYEPADEAGTSDFGIIFNPYSKSSATADTDKSFWDLYKSSNGTHLEGAPQRILRDVVALATGDDPIICSTDKNLVQVNNESFERIADFGDLFFEAPATCSPTHFGVGGVAMRNEIVINDNKVYTVSFNGASRNNYFGTEKTGEYGTLAPWASEVKSAYYDAVVYDQEAMCFRCVNRSSTAFSTFATQDPEAAFDVNHVGMKLLLNDWGRNYTDLFLMQSDNLYYLTIANFQLPYSTTVIGQGIYDITASPDIAKATTMAAAYNGEYVLYGAGNKVYNLAYNKSTTATEAWTAPSTDEEVTCVQLHKYYYQAFFARGFLPQANKVVHIATWNEKTQEGKVYEYVIDAASGAISGNPYIYTVPGKVKDMSWRYAMS